MSKTWVIIALMRLDFLSAGLACFETLDPRPVGLV